MSGPQLDAVDVRGLYAIMPTPAVPGSDDPALEDTLDRPETERAARALVADGADAVLTTGTFGECATLTWTELRDFTDVVVSAVAGRVPVFVGATTLNTRDTIARAKALRDIGVNGLLLGRPMWCQVDDDDLVAYYRAVAEAVPDLALVVYDNPEAFKGKITTAAYARLAEIPQVVAAKYPVFGPTFADDLAAVDGRMRLLPVDRDWLAAHRLGPGDVLACWSGAASCGPRPQVELARRILTGDLGGADALVAELGAASAGFFPEGSFALFSRYNIQLEKIRINAAGYIDAGPCRPPYIGCPEPYAAGARASGTKLAALHARYAQPAGTLPVASDGA
ncbi:dihydrodipicolinate synthase family protein [Pseudonocardia sp. KRD291]|uniref:dihydrodipicolinate synthase family protein n=1 Tax=Pseudonocardia sp. KRD291 TaxID=2792007 RepID=UPI001C4A49FE|nr:dihydrodipicolinate synthase family protein [Pseudonocardia sp. KRD291]MBW0101433.1 dihydrodipicolinate synthase family protein [Pseudonocardia sp. KRD291]